MGFFLCTFPCFFNFSRKKDKYGRTFVSPGYLSHGQTFLSRKNQMKPPYLPWSTKIEGTPGGISAVIFFPDSAISCELVAPPGQNFGECSFAIICIDTFNNNTCLTPTLTAYNSHRVASSALLPSMEHSC
eukprot:TRINITY_DN258_c0_g1_i3.p1 TRINITY_DN258_c0_g1~~TRINITY_DN258_c0_g1_i3.p1  ORF type:complete len:130 (+),score=1.49 TRINITY_DN258_c0_g1_i3:872-1261(+)